MFPDRRRIDRNNRLRFWFLLPAWVWLIFLFLAPLAIVCAYSLLARGVYGGVEPPWTLESYQRLMDPLYAIILVRSIVLAAAATAICLVLALPLALFISRSTRRKKRWRKRNVQSRAMPTMRAPTPRVATHWLRCSD